MKKILLAVALVATVMASGCSGSSKEVKENETDLKTKIENATSPDSVAVYVAQAYAYADSLAKAGKVDEAKAYLDGIQPAVDKADPSLKEQFKAAISSIGSAATAAADSVASQASAAVDSAKNVVSDAKDAVKDAATNAANSAVEKGKEAVNAGADKAKAAAAEATNKAADAAKNALDNLKK